MNPRFGGRPAGGFVFEEGVVRHVCADRGDVGGVEAECGADQSVDLIDDGIDGAGVIAFAVFLHHCLECRAGGCVGRDWQFEQDRAIHQLVGGASTGGQGEREAECGIFSGDRYTVIEIV